MKKNLPLLVCILLMFTYCSSCAKYDDHSLSIHLSDSDEAYEMTAWYDKKYSGHVDDFLTGKFDDGNTLFRATKIKGDVILNNHAKIYLKKYPGYLKIKFEKDKNSTAAYNNIKSGCESLKKILSGKKD